MLLTKKEFHWLHILTGLFVGVLLISEISAVKVVQLGALVLPGAVIIFPLTYILGDVLTEVYGYAKARQAIWTGFVVMAVMVGLFTLVGKLPPAPFWQNQGAWDTIMGMTPRIVIASLIAFLVGGFSNSYVLAKMKLKSKGKDLWKRTIGSTIVGEALDTVIFITIAFWGIIEPKTLLIMIASQYAVKVAIEIIITPITYQVVGYLKSKEREDAYDSKTDFNPFHVSE